MFYHPVAFFFFEVITNLVDVLIVSALVYWIYSLVFKGESTGKKMIGMILAPVFITGVITIILKVLIHRGVPTPFVIPFLEIQLLPVHYSFPSGHAGRAFAFATALSYKFPRRWPLFFAGVAIIGFSRIYVGAHFPADVVAGALLGISISWLFHRFEK